nr:MAG TPA: hypothetical protein [Bacteriophage sp.]
MCIYAFLYGNILLQLFSFYKKRKHINNYIKCHFFLIS